MDKQLSNKTGLIRFFCLFNYMTDFLSQAPFLKNKQKKPCGNQARDKDSSLMQLRERERPEVSLANSFIHNQTCGYFASGAALFAGKAKAAEWEWCSPTS